MLEIERLEASVVLSSDGRDWLGKTEVLYQQMAGAGMQAGLP